MTGNNIHSRQYAPVILRLGLAAVFMWFGLNQILDESMWTSLIPSWLASFSGLSPGAIVLFNGVFEIIAGILISFGIQIRIVASLLAIHMLFIIIDLGLSAVGIRDMGLLFATVSISLHGADMASCDMLE